MGKYVMVVQSQAKPGRDQDFNAWYDSTHLADILAIPGIKSGRRFTSTEVGLGAAVMPYLAIFEVELDDPRTIMAEMGKRSQDGTMKGSDAVDGPATILRFYEHYEAG